MVRVGQTEGSVDLARLAGLKPAAVICEIMDDDGTMARMPSLEQFSDTHDIGICTVADLVEYRIRTESFVHRAAETVIPTLHGGDFRMIAFENDVDNLTHIALVKAADFDSMPFRSIFACGVTLYLFTILATIAVRMLTREREAVS